MTISDVAATVRNGRPEHIGEHLRYWRRRRHLSQLDLASEADVSARHLSFLETGRATPSRDMVMRLAERLDVPLRERNAMLVAAGFAPVFPQRSLDHPSLGAARGAIDRILKGHEPNPAVAIDRHWNLVAANAMVGELLTDVAPDLLAPPVNVLRLSFHPEGLAPRTVNLAEWCFHLLDRLYRQWEAVADPVLLELYRELKTYPVPARQRPLPRGEVAIPFKLRHGEAELSFISTTMVFGTPLDVTLAELAIEAFFPADEATSSRLQDMAARRK